MRHTSYEVFKAWFGTLPSSLPTITRPHWWDCWKVAVEYGVELEKEREHPKPKEPDVSETKREDHALWGAFVDWFGVRETSPHYELSCACNWPVFLAGGEAMAEYLPKKVAAAHVTPRCKVLADCLTDAVERLEELGKRQDNALNLGSSVLAATTRLEELTEKHEKMGLMVTVMENADVTLGGLTKG